MSILMTRDRPLREPAELAAVAAIALSVLLALVELAKIALFAPAAKVAVAGVAVAAFLPLHVWHLRYGLRGRRPPRAAATLTAMVAVQVTAALIIGPGWALMLAALATSGLIVLAPRWSAALLVACVIGAVALRLGDDSPYVDPLTAPAAYLAVAVIFRSVIQFVLVWFVAAVSGLHDAREALAEDAVRRTRARLEADVRRSLETSLHSLVAIGEQARVALARFDAGAARAALDRVLYTARAALSEMRDALIAARAAVPASSLPSAATALAETVRAAESPVGRALAAPRRTRLLLLVAVHACVLGFPALSVSGLLGLPAAKPELALPALAVIAALQLAMSLAVGRGDSPRWGGLAFAAIATIAIGLLPVLRVPWLPALWPVGAAGAMILRGPWRALPIAAVVLTIATWTVSVDAPYALDVIVWDAVYNATISVMAAGSLYGAARLARMVDELSATRFALAARAIEGERGRLSAELHDVLGQSLTAVSLKGDLAQRLVERDPEGATREIDDLVAIARRQLPELDAIAQGERRTSLATEAPEAAALLRAAGMEVRVEVRLPDVSAEADALLGWAVREGATNVLRHSRARTCSIVATRDGDRLLLELVNDGIGATAHAPGSGLSSLAERFAAAKGVVLGGRIDGERFRLRVELPA